MIMAGGLIGLALSLLFFREATSHGRKQFLSMAHEILWGLRDSGPAFVKDWDSIGIPGFGVRGDERINR